MQLGWIQPDRALTCGLDAGSSGWYLRWRSEILKPRLRARREGGVRLLFVEDDPQLCQVAVRWFSVIRPDIAVVVADAAADAIARLAVESFDAVSIDLSLKHSATGGVKVAAAAKLLGIPFLFCTVSKNAPEGWTDRVLVRKPFEFRALASQLEALVNPRDAA